MAIEIEAALVDKLSLAKSMSHSDLEALRAELTAFMGAHVPAANPSGGDGALSSSSSSSGSEESSDASTAESEEAM
ncbi:hypothetical protein ACLB2K_025792 [Fragaria x ananassa]